MKSKKVFICKVCQFESVKWYGRCPNCKSWESFLEEEKIISNNTINKTKHPVSISNARPETFAEVLQKQDKNGISKFPFESRVLNDFWNQGIVASSLTLLAGEPGLGKSTLALQILRQLRTKNPQLNLLYVTAEESSLEVATRSERLKIPKDILLLQANNFEAIENLLLKNPPQVVIIDSIQTIFSSNLQASPGSISQVVHVATQFLALAKSQNIAVILIGHVTKEGQIAGPKTLEHLVDSVLVLESSEIHSYRTLTFNKHRYGSTENQLLLKMEENGLEVITDPTLALLENLEIGKGICYGLAMQKNLPIVCEVQALVSKQNYGEGGFGRREAIGFKTSKLNTLLAIAEKYLNLDLKNRDVYLQLSGLPKNVTDDSLDLPVLLAILSSLKEKTIAELLKIESKKISVFSGRLTLSGSIRLPTLDKAREKTAEKIKLNYNPKITFSSIDSSLKYF